MKTIVWMGTAWTGTVPLPLRAVKHDDRRVSIEVGKAGKSQLTWEPATDAQDSIARKMMDDHKAMFRPWENR